MSKELFRKNLLSYFSEFKKAIATDKDEWTVKGFIDVYKNIYTISLDTKVVSKIIELLLFPIIAEFASKHDYDIILAQHQNHYPDITFINENNEKIAVDIKTTYVKTDTMVNKFTLGTFTGYFRDRNNSKNITYPYNDYSAHYVLGIIYHRNEEIIDENKKYSLDELENIVSVIKNFDFILQEKWKIASDKPGSGNTKNIGSITNIEDLKNGDGTFSKLGEEVFNDYWSNFLTSDMARAIDSPIPYKNVNEYLNWEKRIIKS
ncbi:MAG: hypothetical protein LBM96_12330 [Methanobrevibacter sp.]|jgi:hypothetical protein|nr:hypothetical protein [Candidatus Methanoflexus mossambicus]